MHLYKLDNTKYGEFRNQSKTYSSIDMYKNIFTVQIFNWQINQIVILIIIRLKLWRNKEIYYL